MKEESGYRGCIDTAGHGWHLGTDRKESQHLTSDKLRKFPRVWSVNTNRYCVVSRTYVMCVHGYVQCHLWEDPETG